MPVATANQTIGPYWHLIEDPTWADLTRFGAEGEKIILTGTLFDGGGNIVADAAVEIWQTSPPASDIFPAFGRCRTDASGSFRFTTLKPGPRLPDWATPSRHPTLRSRSSPAAC